MHSVVNLACVQLKNISSIRRLRPQYERQSKLSCPTKTVAFLWAADRNKEIDKAALAFLNS